MSSAVEIENEVTMALCNHDLYRAANHKDIGKIVRFSNELFFCACNSEGSSGVLRAVLNDGRPDRFVVGKSVFRFAVIKVSEGTEITFRNATSKDEGRFVFDSCIHGCAKILKHWCEGSPQSVCQSLSGDSSGACLKLIYKQDLKVIESIEKPAFRASVTQVESQVNKDDSSSQCFGEP